MIHYGYTSSEPHDGHHGEIHFTTDNEEMFNLVSNMIETIIDATKWRNQVVKVSDKNKL
jgi:tRNA G46 methylase TrmB